MKDTNIKVGTMNTVHGVGPDAPVKVNSVGAKQSDSPYRCDLLPPNAILSVAAVLKKGAAKYGDNNWYGLSVKEILDHLITHAFAYLAGDEQENHLSHVACRALMALELKIIQESCEEKEKVNTVSEDIVSDKQEKNPSEQKSYTSVYEMLNDTQGKELADEFEEYQKKETYISEDITNWKQYAYVLKNTRLWKWGLGLREAAERIGMLPSAYLDAEHCKTCPYGLYEKLAKVMENTVSNIRENPTYRKQE